MPRIVRCGLIQAASNEPADSPIEKIKKAMVDKHLAMIGDAAKQGVQIICLQELFYGPYFPAEQNPHWYDLVERIPEGPTTQLMCEIAKQHRMAMVVPIYEEEMTGVYYNTAAVIDADGKYLGKYRKTHIPPCLSGVLQKIYFTPCNSGFPTFETKYPRIGVYICYDGHLREGA